MRKIIACSLLVLLAGCVADGDFPAAPTTPSTPQPSPPAENLPYAISSADRRVIEGDIRSSLKDPNSAIFGAMVASKGSKGAVNVCGWVNAKNSFGGYTGDRPFVGFLIPGEKKFMLLSVGSSDESYRSVLRTCQTVGGITI